MASIRETDLMVVCVEAAKNYTQTNNMEVHDALHRISDAMYESKVDGSEVSVIKVADNPVDRDIARRMTTATIGLVLGMEEK